jgi:hypothetical protein
MYQRQAAHAVDLRRPHLLRLRHFAGDMYACARVMGSYYYISNRNVCAQTAQTWNLFNDDRCTLPENWTRML